MSFSKSSLVLALTLAISVTARPYDKRWGGWGGSWGSWGGHHDSLPPSSAPGYMDFLKRGVDVFASQNCDLQSAVDKMPLSKVSPALPAPNPDLSLFQVVVGRGTQNYTCDMANSTATPVPVGAVASLYDFSCAAVYSPPLLKYLPIVALDLPVPSSGDENSPINTFLSGHHYFLDDTTPFFNMDTVSHQYGMGALKKANASDAPENAYKGPRDQGDGAVSWLKLDQKDFAEDSWKEVYRLNTAGGNPPKMCTGQPASFEVDYAAEYWIFK